MLQKAPSAFSVESGDQLETSAGGDRGGRRFEASDTGTRGPWLGLEVLGTEGEGWGAGGGGAPAVDTRGGASPAACTQDLVADDAFLVGLWGVACTVLNIFRKG